MAKDIKPNANAIFANHFELLLVAILFPFKCESTIF